MIHPKEINKYAGLNHVSDRQIEKDYILTWVLYGISQHTVLKKAMAFKGGTVLKKVYFEDYRFSYPK
jgi:predicted nucleotidyltransferase component of viral defense system